MGRKPKIPSELKTRPFTLAEARAAGVPSRALEGKSWRRVGPGLHQWVGLDKDPLQLLLAWQRRLPMAIFAGHTAAWIHGIDVSPTPVEIDRSTAREFVTVRGLRATPVARAFRALKRRLSEIEYLVLADQAFRLGLGRHHELAEAADSQMETRLRWLLRQAGLPRPEVQRKLYDDVGELLGRADLYFAAARLVIEYDGGNHRERMTEDLRRQNAILRAGYQLLRFTAPDVYRYAGVTVAQVRNALVSKL